MNPTRSPDVEGWAPDTWRARPAAQQPDWPDPAALDRALAELARQPPLVFAGEARTLQAALGTVAAGHGFLLQAGDCAESFDAFSADTIRDKLKVILQMAVLLTYGAGLPVGHGQRPGAAARGPPAGPGAHAARLPPVLGHAEPAAGLHQGRLRRPQPGAHLEPGVRGRQPRRAALRGGRRRHRPGAALHGRLRHRPHRLLGPAPGRLLYLPR